MERITPDLVWPKGATNNKWSHLPKKSRRSCRVQLLVTPAQAITLKRKAKEAGVSVSSLILAEIVRTNLIK